MRVSWALSVVFGCYHGAAAPPPLSGDAPPAPPAPTGTRVLEGTWQEQFPGRGGCSDEATIVASPRLDIAGADCNDGEHYGTQGVAFDGKTLRFAFRVPSTLVTVTYVLSFEPDTNRSVLAGTATVVGPDLGPNEFEVRWTRNK